MDTILLKGGIVLFHEDDDSISVLRDTDVLVSNSTIRQIAKAISVDDSSKVDIIDCEDKIICPGFIDTHHHPWQTQMKGTHSDDTLVDYFPTGNLQSFNYLEDDVFWGELAGLMDAIDDGTTTIVDHSHVTRSPNFGMNASLAHDRSRSTLTWNQFSIRRTCSNHCVRHKVCLLHDTGP